MELTTDEALMLKAIEEAKKCVSVETAYNVGAIITAPEVNCTEDVKKPDTIISKGYSRQHPGNTHAEECALLNLSLAANTKLSVAQLRELDDCSNGLAKGCTIYTTMEPCSKRLSGNRSCTSRLISSGVARVVIGVKEPDKFVMCEGTSLLKAEGIKIDYIQNEAIIEACKNLNSV